MRRAKTDSNQREIVRTFRDLGCSVESLHRVGGGVPDLLIGFRGRNYLVEVKMGKNSLNDLQREWVSGWRGTVYLCTSAEDAMRLVTAYWSQ